MSKKILPRYAEFVAVEVYMPTETVREYLESGEITADQVTAFGEQLSNELHAQFELPPVIFEGMFYVYPGSRENSYTIDSLGEHTAVVRRMNQNSAGHEGELHTADIHKIQVDLVRGRAHIVEEEEVIDEG